jgi:hypothetical protein
LYYLNTYCDPKKSHENCFLKSLHPLQTKLYTYPLGTQKIFEKKKKAYACVSHIVGQEVVNQELRLNSRQFSEMETTEVLTLNFTV